MIVGPTLELDGAVSGHIRFPCNGQGSGEARCPRPPHCRHILTQQQCEQLLERVGITYGGDSLATTRRLITSNRALDVLERDSLGIAYKAFEVFRPAVPEATLESYGLSNVVGPPTQ